METRRLTLEPCTEQHLESLVAGAEDFEKRFGIRVVDQYLEFPEALGHSLVRLQSGEVEPAWWTHLFIHRQDHALMGMGGYAGAPDAEGSVEIGYSIAPTYRGQGYATEAAQGLIDNAFRDDAVKGVIAHTLAEENSSAAVLRKCGMTKTREIMHPEDGKIWRWELRKADRQSGR